MKNQAERIADLERQLAEARKKYFAAIVACRQGVWDVLGNDLHLIPAIEEAMDSRIVALEYIHPKDKALAGDGGQEKPDA